LDISSYCAPAFTTVDIAIFARDVEFAGCHYRRGHE
jgi:hypothetical protein